MPTIENRKTGKSEFVSAEIWQMLHDKGLAARFKVVDRSDLQATVIPTPINFTEPEDFTDFDTEMTKKEIMEKLDEKGVVYKMSETKEQLLNKL